jgi:cytochrome bd-type quinol oxidase subunit 2
MENTGISRYTISFGLSLALASVVNGLLVVAKEKSPAVQAAMQKLTGNHWVTHVVIVLAAFLLSGWLFAQANGGQGIKMTANHLIRAIVAGVAAGGLIILGFYLIGD